MYVDQAANFIAQWDDEALIRRDKNPQRRTHHTAAAATATWDTYSQASVLLEEGTVDGGEWETALGANDEPSEDPKLGRDRGGRNFRRRLDRGAPTGGHRAGRSIWLTGSSGGLCYNRVQECLVGHEERHTNVHAGQESVSRTKQTRSYFPVVGVGSFRWFSNYNAEKIATDWCSERYGHWHEEKDVVGDTDKGKSPRDSRRPAPTKSRLTSTGPSKGGPAHGTRAHLQPGQCLVCRQMGHRARDCPNRGMRDDSGINLIRAFGCFVGMTKKNIRCFF